MDGQTDVYEDEQLDQEQEPRRSSIGPLIAMVAGGAVVGGLIAALAVIGIGQMLTGPGGSGASGQRSAVVEAAGSVCTHLASEARGGPAQFASETWTCRTSDGDQLGLNIYSGEGPQRDALVGIAAEYDVPIDQAPVVCGDGFSITGEIEATATALTNALTQRGIPVRLCSDWS